MELSDVVVDMDVSVTMTKKRKTLRFKSHNGVANAPLSLVSPVESDETAGSSKSCCSRNRSSNLKSLDLDENGLEIADNSSSKEKRSSSNEESGKLESKKMPPHDDEDPPPGKIPFMEEIDEFLTRCEKKILKRFREKYNFDFEKEEPLEGRYKWVQT